MTSGTGLRGSVFTVNPTTGAVASLSNFGNTAQGSLGEDPSGIVLETNGNILVIDRGSGTAGAGALFRVNPTTDARTRLSDFGNQTQGLLGVDPTGVALDTTTGDILVIDPLSGTNSKGALFRVNPITGARTLLSDFGNAAQGPLGVDPTGVTFETTTGNILVIDTGGFGTGTEGALFRVDFSGARTILSDFGNAAQGPLGLDPRGVALDATGNILVIDQVGVLFRVNPITGARTLLSNFDTAAQGPVGNAPFGLALGLNGHILVIDPGSNTGGPSALFRVNPTTGDRTLVTRPGVDPFAVAVAPLLSPGDLLVIDFDSGTNNKGALFKVNPTTGNRILFSDFGNPEQGP